jgi:CRP-like cAMP-binding protein
LAPTALAHIPKAAVLRTLRRDRTFAVSILEEISRRAQEAALESTTRSCAARYSVITFLLNGVAPVPHGDALAIQLPVPKGVVASWLNIAPETLSRTLRQLTRDGLIIVERRRITILSLDRLRVASSECQGLTRR